MAKSLRSKWAKKVRAERRQKFADKELARLKDMLENAKQLESLYTLVPSDRIKHDDNEKCGREEMKSENGDIEMMEEDNVITIEDCDPSERIDQDLTPLDGERKRQCISTKYGKFPRWYNGRQIRKAVRKAKTAMKVKKRRLAKKKKVKAITRH